MKKKTARTTKPPFNTTSSESVEQAEYEERNSTGLTIMMAIPLAFLVLPVLATITLAPPKPGSPSSVADTALEAPLGHTKGKKPTSPIVWHTSLEKARALAQKTGKTLLLDFYADWCQPCKEMEADVYTHPEVIQEAKNTIMVKLNVDKQREAVIRYDASTLPMLVWLDANGTEKGRTRGYTEASELVSLMRQYR